MTGIYGGAVFRRHISSVKIIFYANGDAQKRARPFSIITGSCPGEGLGRVKNFQAPMIAPEFVADSLHQFSWYGPAATGAAASVYSGD